jgi:signal recognition particle subunit SRP68
LPNLFIRPAQISFLQSLLHKLVSRYRALAELESLNAASDVSFQTNPTTEPPLVERLHEYPSHGANLTNLVTYPPQVQPVPVKPLFLDVAWNYIDYPGRTRNEAGPKINGTIDEGEKAEVKKEAKKGWFGFGR